LLIDKFLPNFVFTGAAIRGGQRPKNGGGTCKKKEKGKRKKETQGWGPELG